MTFLAVKYLLARRRQTVLMLLGIFFGTAAYVAISGFMLGFREYLVEQLINNNAHIHIQAREEFLTNHSLDHSFYKKAYDYIFWSTPPSGRKDSAIVENPQLWYERLRNDPRVVAYSPQLTTSVIFSKGKATVPATLIGCDPLQQTKVTTIGEYITQGKFSDLAVGGNRVILGDELMNRLGARVSENIFLSLANSAPIPFKVVGIYKTGNKLADASAYGAIGDVQRVSKSSNKVNEIAVKLVDHSQASAIASTWAKLGLEKVQSWDQVNANIFEIFKIQDAVRFLSIGAIMVVAAFGIYNVLNMTVMQKKKDVAILHSMGYSTKDIVSLFFTQGIILGFTGVILGLSFGYVFCLYLQTIPFGGGPTAVGTGYLMVSFNPAIYVQAAGLAFLAATIASVLPAYAAGKLTPIEIIRSGAE
ncbi:MAG: ABC transporter permease [Oligoflexia bacterium]|nr:ABC transporter permease [Oligoflexia bacterium]